MSCEEVKGQAYTEETYISEELKPYVKSFIEEGDKRGFDARPYFKVMDSLKINNKMSKGELGLYHYKYVYFNELGYYVYSSIDINSFNLLNHKLLRSTVFHELAHACGYVGHPCDRCGDILSTYTSIDYSYYRDLTEEEWSSKVDDLFTQIKSIPSETNIVKKYIEKLN